MTATFAGNCTELQEPKICSLAQ